MSKNSGVIMQTVDSSFFNAPPKAHPHNAYVVSYKDGSTRSFSGAPSASDRWGSRYCYIVDTGEHGMASTCRVQSAVDAYAFDVDLDAVWQVTDAEAVVRANMVNGDEAVRVWLEDELWRVGRQFQPENATAAEAAARAAVSGAHRFEQGITVLQSKARFRADRQLMEGRRQLDQDALQGQLDQQQLERLNRLDGSDEAAVREHLLRHPEDTQTVLTMLAAGRERNQGMYIGVLKELLDRNLITDADVGPLRDFVLGTGQAPPGLSSARSQVPSARPLLSLPAGVSSATSGDPAPAPAPPVVSPSPAVSAEDAPPGATAPQQPGTDPPTARPGTGRGGVKQWKPVKSAHQRSG